METSPPAHMAAVGAAGATVVLTGVTYRGRRHERVSEPAGVHDITLAIAAGQSVALTGPPDCGASTIVSLIAAGERPDAGTIDVDDVRLSALSRRETDRYRRRIGIVAHDSTLIAALTAIDNVVFPLLYRRVDGDKHGRARELLDLVGLSASAGTRASRLSAAQRRRLAIARAVVHHPTLLLADEPSGGLDRTAATETLDLLMRIVRAYGMTLVLATGEDSVAARCRRVIRMRDGTVTGDVAAHVDDDATRRWIGRPAPLL
jgi:putative ABC transport system ATP-binding protein